MKDGNIYMIYTFLKEDLAMKEDLDFAPQLIQQIMMMLIKPHKF